LPVTALVLSARRPFGPARFKRGLDKLTIWLMGKPISRFKTNLVPALVGKGVPDLLYAVVLNRELLD